VTIRPTSPPTIQAVTAVAMGEIGATEPEDTNTQPAVKRGSFLPAGMDPVIILIALLVLGGAALLILGGVLRRGS